MSLMTMLGNAQGGQLFAQVGRVVELDAAATRKAMDALCPAIALQLEAEARKDPELLDTLLDLLEDGAEGMPLDDPEALTGAEAIADGNAILDDIYGTRTAAMAAMGLLAGDVPETTLAKLAPMSATAVVAALTQANVPMSLTGVQPAKGTSRDGILSTIINAIIAGAVQSILRQLAPKKRKSTSSYSRSKSKSKSKSTRSRSKTKSSSRKKSASTQKKKTSATAVEDIFREILGNIGK